MNHGSERLLLRTAEVAQRAYQSPRLSMLGDVGSLTETGSMLGMEDGVQNNMCNGNVAPINMTFNMC